jgi:hypothetical protein
MIGTKKLMAAKIEISKKNLLLQALWSTVCAYNQAEQAPKEDRIALLERIMAGAGEWLTAKPPKATTTNLGRWAAMDDLAQQVVGEAAKLGVRFLSGPTDWKTISENNRSYWLEYLCGPSPWRTASVAAPGPVFGALLSKLYGEWLQKSALPNARQDSFWNYARIEFPNDKRFVTYYGDDAEAEKSRLEFREDGRLYSVWTGMTFDTKGLQTVSGGSGWAMFVLSPMGKIFAGSHDEGRFHHSTFLGGSAVAAAGEFVVEDGRIKVITAKSGHYQPTVAEMKRLVVQVPGIPANVVILPDFIINPPQFFRVGEFRSGVSTPKQLKQKQVKDAIPHWALWGGFEQKILSKVPA